MKYEQIITKLETLSDPQVAKKMAKFGIIARKSYGISMPELRKIAKNTGENHKLAKRLWQKNSRETKILASLIEDYSKVNEEQMDFWVKDFDSWEICDQCCINLFWRTPFAYKKAIEWSSRKEEFVKRAAFSLMAVLAIHDKNMGNEEFVELFPYIKKQSTDNRHYVKKSINWALRQIGKRNAFLHKQALKLAEEIKKINSKSAKWVASDAIRELRSEKILNRIKNYERKI